MAHYSSDGHIYIAPGENGKSDKNLDNYHNLQNVLKHERFHEMDADAGIETTFITHASVYLRQMQDDTFKSTSQDFAEGMMNNFIHFVDTAKHEKMEDYKSLIDNFNSSNIRGGYKIEDRPSGGIQLFDPKGQELIFPLTPTLLDPH